VFLRVSRDNFITALNTNDSVTLDLKSAYLSDKYTNMMNNREALMFASRMLGINGYYSDGGDSPYWFEPKAGINYIAQDIMQDTVTAYNIIEGENNQNVTISCAPKATFLEISKKN
jgi:hypothetical protein